MGTIGTRVTIILVGVGVGRVEYERALELITEVCKGVCLSTVLSHSSLPPLLDSHSIPPSAPPERYHQPAFPLLFPGVRRSMHFVLFQALGKLRA